MARTPATSRRAAPTKVSKPFPWGTALGSLALAVALVGLITYAALNQGSGVSDLIRNPDGAIDGVVVAEEELSRNHTATTVAYPQTPPVGGEHAPEWQTCDSNVYTAPIANENAVHSMEHGAVWVTYNDSVPEDQVQDLAQRVQGATYTMMSPLPEQTSPINLTAWGRRLSVDSADDKRVADFITGFANGPTTPERGATCSGGTLSTGPLQAPPAAPPQMTPPSAAVQVPVQPTGAAPAPSAAPAS